MSEATPSHTISFTLPQDKDVTVTIDTSAFPEKTVAHLLTSAARHTVTNRTNSAAMKYKKALETFKVASDPTAGDKYDPKATAPTAPDFAAIATKAKAEMLDGTVADRGTAAPKERKDPLTVQVTQAVTRKLFDKMRQSDATVKWPSVVAIVGGDGIAYLNRVATEKAGSDAAKLATMLKSIETDYLAPARKMLGLKKDGTSAEADADSLI